jgi:hypothetical protein
MEWIRIVRYANEGFSPMTYSTGEYFYKGEIFDYNVKNKINLEDPLLIKPSEWSGNYCYFHMFDIKSVEDRGILGHRKGHTINVGYLPGDYLVYVRALNADDQPAIHINRHTQSLADQLIFEFDKTQSLDKFNWLKMKLSLAVQRNQEHLMKNKREVAEERFTEMLLFPEDIEHITQVRQVPFGSAIHKFPLTKTGSVEEKQAFWNRLLMKVK